jgi:hypothetical protein
MAFQKAVKHESKLRLAITGPSGAGKTYTALSIARSLPQPVALVDTEHGSASKYADLFEFDVMNLQPPYHPDRFVEAIRDAAQAGYRVIILDSLTHAWNGTGGMLELVDEIAKRSKTGNTFAAWKDAGPIQSRLIESIVGAPIHVIATLRSKQDYTQEKDANGRTVIKKVGMAAQQREGFEYEFDVVIDMNIDHEGIVTKTRCPALTDRVIAKPGKEVADTLTDWLKGAPVSVFVEQPAQPLAEWQTWKSADEAMTWAMLQFGDDMTFDTIRQQYNDLKSARKPKKAAEMFQAWYESIVEESARVEPADAAQAALLETGNPYN